MYVRPFVGFTKLDIVGVVVQAPWRTRGTPSCSTKPKPTPTPTVTVTVTPSPTAGADAGQIVDEQR